MRKEKIILIGGGGHCKSVIDILHNSDFEIVGILDLPNKTEKTICNHPILGTDELISEYASRCKFLITIGQIKNPLPRKRLYDLVIAKGGTLASIVSKDSYVSGFAHIGDGSIVMNQAFVNSEAIIGKNCIINTKSLIEHETIIGDHTHISTGVIVNGNCIIGKNCFIGSGSILSNNIQIPDNTIIGMGTNVTKTINEQGIYFGNPIKKHFSK